MRTLSGSQRTSRAALGLVLLVFVAAACGARVTEEQRAAAGATSQQFAAGAGDSGAGGVVGSAVETPVPEGGSPTSGDAPGAGPGTSVADSAATSGPPPAANAATDVGVTPNSIVLGHVSSLSGPIPGLFMGAVTATQAAIAHQNSLGGVHGRRLQLEVRDDQLDANTNRSMYQELIPKVLAFSGGFSIFDSAVRELEKAGAPAVQIALSEEMTNSPISFSVTPNKRGAVTGPWNLVKEKFPNAIRAVGAIYGDTASSRDNYVNMRAMSESLGYKYIYDRAYQPTESEFTADVVRMRQSGVKLFFTNADHKTVARIAKAMQQQNFKPELFLVLATAYDPTFLPLAGDSAEGILTIVMSAMFQGEDSAFNDEVRLMNEWIQKVRPNAKPDLYAAYGWASTRLMIKALQDTGPDLTRQGLLTALRKIDRWDSYGLLPEAGPASKRPPSCFLMVEIRGGKFQRWESPPPGFNCRNTSFFVRG